MPKYFIEWKSATTPWATFDVPTELTEWDAIGQAHEMLNAWSNVWTVTDFRVTMVDKNFCNDLTCDFADAIATRWPEARDMQAVAVHLEDGE